MGRRTPHGLHVRSHIRPSPHDHRACAPRPPSPCTGTPVLALRAFTMLQVMRASYVEALARPATAAALAAEAQSLRYWRSDALG